MSIKKLLKKRNIETEKIEMVGQLIDDIRMDCRSVPTFEYLWSEILPFSLNAMSNEINEEIVNMLISSNSLKRKYMNQYKGIGNFITNLSKKVLSEYMLIVGKIEDNEYYEQNEVIPNIEDEWSYNHKKYHRRYLSKQRYFKKSQKPYKYQRDNDKSHQQRFQKKMKKYNSN